MSKEKLEDLNKIWTSFDSRVKLSNSNFGEGCDYDKSRKNKSLRESDAKWEQFLEKLAPYQYNEQLMVIKKDIAHGSFGTISSAHGPEESMELAVKTFTKKWDDMLAQEKYDFVREIDLSIHFNHKNVVRCFGFVYRPVQVVYEYCAHGSFIDFRNAGKTKFLTITDRVKILIGACRGLIYLLIQGILHCDIAGRNILIDENYTAKISDFGRSRKLKNLYGSKHDDVKLPWKWAAPESLYRLECTKKSDVWAFGVAMWEIITDKEPYADIQLDELIGLLNQGDRLSVSEIKSRELRELLYSCWYKDPEERPTMKNIEVQLREKILPLVLHQTISDKDIKSAGRFRKLSPSVWNGGFPMPNESLVMVQKDMTQDWADYKDHKITICEDNDLPRINIHSSAALPTQGNFAEQPSRANTMFNFSR